MKNSIKNCMSLYPKKWGRLVNVCNGSPCPQSLVATPLHLLLVFLWCLLCKVNKHLCQVWKLLYSLYFTRDLSKSITWHSRIEIKLFFCGLFMENCAYIQTLLHSEHCFHRFMMRQQFRTIDSRCLVLSKDRKKWDIYRYLQSDIRSWKKRTWKMNI